MAGDNAPPTGPDFAEGIALSDIPLGGILAGRFGDDAVLLYRAREGVFAVGAKCTHYGAPLAEGLVRGGRVHCPWHHACFSLRTGEALQAPAFDALDRYAVAEKGGRVIVTGKADPAPMAEAPGKGPKDIVIVGGGAAGFATAEMLRRKGYAGTLTMLSADNVAPVDRPNLSKDYLAGNAPPEWIPLKGDDFYADRRIDVRLNTEIVDIDVQARVAIAKSGDRFPYDALLLATGAEPIRLNTPGFDLPNVHTLRSLADSSAIIAAAKEATRVAVIGASFIGLEVAASLRARDIEVHVVAPEKLPLEKILGPELGAHIRDLHQAKGVSFHLERTGTSFDGKKLTLSDGTRLEVDLIVQGVGVRPRTALAEKIALTVDNGIVVDPHFRTSADGIFAAGDIARYPHAITGDPVRVEHWVAAEREGQVAAFNMLGEHLHLESPPFFWSQHYDTVINYVGSGVGWDRHEIDGSVEQGDCTVRYYKGDTLLAAATIGRDVENLKIEAELEDAAES